MVRIGKYPGIPHFDTEYGVFVYYTMKVSRCDPLYVHQYRRLRAVRSQPEANAKCWKKAVPSGKWLLPEDYRSEATRQCCQVLQEKMKAMPSVLEDGRVKKIQHTPEYLCRARQKKRLCATHFLRYSWVAKFSRVPF